MTVSYPKTWSFYLIILLITCLPGLSFSQESILISYVEQGLKNNQGLKQQNFILQKNLNALKEAKTFFLPEVNFTGNYLDSRGGRKINLPIGDLLNPVYNSLNQLTNASSFPEVKNIEQTFNPNNYYDAKFRTSLPIFDAEIIYNKKIRTEEIGFQRAEIEVYRRELVKDIQLAYYSFLQTLESIRILENATVLARENLRYNQTLVKNDKAIRTAVSRADNEMIGLQARMEDAKYQSTNAAAYFNFLLNVPFDTKIEVPSVGQETHQTDTTSSSPREELARLGAAQNINALSLQLARSANLPKLSTFIDLGSQGDFLKFNNTTRYYLFGVTLTWQVFAANRNLYKAKQAEFQIKATNEQISQVEQQLLLQAETASNKLKSARQMYEASRSQVVLSEQYYQDQRKLYREGQLLYLELLDAQNRLISDQLQQSISYLNVQTRAVELQRAKASYPLSN
jgi:outer membrane protein TolC